VGVTIDKDLKKVGGEEEEEVEARQKIRVFQG
jgi:hypothetical protein